jgi:hypothetical protein
MKIKGLRREIGDAYIVKNWGFIGRLGMHVCEIGDSLGEVGIHKL